MEKIKRVAVAEYLNAVRSKAFVLSVVMAPLIMAFSIGIQIMAEKKVDRSPRKFAVVDRSGQLFDSVVRAAENRNKSLDAPMGKIGKIVGPKAPFVPSLVESDDDHEALILNLSSQVRRKEIFAFVVIGKDVMLTEGKGERGIRYFSQTPTYRELPSWIERTLNTEVRRGRINEAGLDAAQINRLSRQVQMEKLGLSKKSSTGKVEKARKDNQIANLLVPVVAMVMMFVIVMTSAPMLMNTVLEEKMNKVSEVLIASVTPFQLMFGKLVGCVLVAMTLSLLYIGSLAAALTYFGVLSLIPIPLIIWFFVFQILALFIFGSMFLAIGSACNEIRDAQSLMMPAMMLVMVPMLTWMPILKAPNSPFSQTMSLIPPFTPMLMTMRLASPPGPAVWELVLGFVLTGLFMFACVWAAARIFRIGLLAQGQSPSFAKLISWLWSK
ncbi:MAG: ABC transporter permease [Verrucomicrobiia bacterium]|jgi:ABC-2 type transport system permease protein